MDGNGTKGPYYGVPATIGSAHQASLTSSTGIEAAGSYRVDTGHVKHELKKSNTGGPQPASFLHHQTTTPQVSKLERAW